MSQSKPAYALRQTLVLTRTLSLRIPNPGDRIHTPGTSSSVVPASGVFLGFVSKAAKERATARSEREGHTPLEA